MYKNRSVCVCVCVQSEDQLVKQQGVGSGVCGEFKEHRLLAKTETLLVLHPHGDKRRS